MRARILFLILIVFAGCDSDGVTARLVKMNFDSNMFTGSKPEYVLTFAYDSEGRVVRIRNTSTTSPAQSETQISYSENLVEIQRESSTNSISLENGLIKQYAARHINLNESFYDTLNFSYTNGRLSQVYHAANKERFFVELDDAGNIMSMVSESHDYRFKYDDRPNPFKGVWVGDFSYGTGVQNIFMARNIAVFFSPNNNGFPYDGNAEYSYGINGYPTKIRSNNMYQDQAEFVYEYVPED